MGILTKLLRSRKKSADRVKWYTLKSMCDVMGLTLPASLKSKANVQISAAIGSHKIAIPNCVYVTTSAITAYEPENVQRAFERGAICGIARRQLVGTKGQEYPTIISPHPVTDLIALSNDCLDLVPCKRVAVTGSVGKTSLKTMFGLVSEAKYKTCISKSNMNGFAQVARIAQVMEPDVEVYIQETGVSRPKRLERSVKVVRPHAFAITNIGLNHVGYFDNKQENILHEKLSLDRYAVDGAVGFINFDDPLLRNAEYIHEVRGCSVDNPEADYYAQDITERNGALDFVVVEKATGTKTKVHLNVIGRHNVFNAVAAFAFGLWLGVDREAMAKALLQFRPEGVRQNFTTIKGRRLYLDCYNASEGALNSVVSTLGTIDVPEGGKRVLVFADIDDKLGNLTEEVHRRVGRTIAQAGTADMLLCYGAHAAWSAEEAKACGVETYATEDRAQLEAWIGEKTTDKDVIAFKGGQQMELSLTVDTLFDTPFFLLDGDMVELYAHTVKLPEGDFRVLPNYGVDFHRASKTAKTLTLPAQVEGFPLRAAGRGCSFERYLESVTIPEPMRALGQNAFSHNTHLKDVVLPASLRYIGVNAFRNCKRLKSIVIPEGVHTIDLGAFQGCESLKEVQLPASLLTINEDAFEGVEHAVFTCPSGSYAHKFMKENYPSANVVAK